MKERDIRLLFNSGHWKQALIIPHAVENGWQVLLSSKDNDMPITLLAKRGGPRLFKTSDAALVWCQSIGFDSVKVHLLGPDSAYAAKKLGANGSVLLIEDNEDDIELIRHTLNKQNINNQLIVKNDGETALEYLFEETENREEIPGLIILDLHLPKLHGLEVLHKIRTHELTKSIPVVVLTTSATESDIQQSYELGSNSYIRKPTDIEQFKTVIEQLSMYWINLNLMPDYL